MPYYYNKTDRIQQLNDLTDLLHDFILFIDKIEYYRNAVPLFKDFAVRVKTIIGSDYEQADLSKLADSFVSIINTHKDWVPPYAEYADGKYVFPEWFADLEKKHDKIEGLIFKIKSIGYY